MDRQNYKKKSARESLAPARIYEILKGVDLFHEHLAACNDVKACRECVDILSGSQCCYLATAEVVNGSVSIVNGIVFYCIH